MTTSRPTPHAEPAAVWWELQTARGAPAAIGIVALGTDDPTGKPLDAILAGLGIRSVPIGSMGLRRLAAIDSGLVVRWSPRRADLFAHGGKAVLEGISRVLLGLGAPERTDIHPSDRYPEARSEIEARMLDALSSAPSPRAVDLLLDQPARWESLDPSDLNADELAPEELCRLIDPPLVVAVGAPNIGKSSLANALAGRTAAIVADAPGTTRDHVGLSLELDGLVVRYLDTPGIDPQQPDTLTAEATRLVMTLLGQADLILGCVDAADPSPVVLPGLRAPVVPVVLRADRLQTPAPADRWGVETSAATGLGIDELGVAVRGALVPDSALSDSRPWRFWQPA